MTSQTTDPQAARYPDTFNSRAGERRCVPGDPCDACLIEECRAEEAAPKPISQPPSLGRTVLYKISTPEAQAINAARGAHPKGNVAWGGSVYPAVIVRVWENGLVNLQVILDGPDNAWATSVSEGTDERQWSWPPRV